MKRVLAAVGLFTLLGFLAAKFTSRPRAAEMVEGDLQTPVIHVNVQQLEEKLLDGRFQAMRRWIAIYRDILDPALVLAVAVIASFATAGFAWWTNEINEQQGAMLERQNEILGRQLEVQSYNSLPLFSVSTPSDEDVRVTTSTSDNDRTASFIISNEGGMARYANIVVRSEIHVSIYPAPNTRLDGPIIPTSYLYGYSWPNPNPGFGQGGWDFYFLADFDAMNDFVRYVEGLVNDQRPDIGVNFSIYNYVKVDYMDYQGTLREEYFYIIEGGLNGEADTRRYSELYPDYRGEARSAFLRDPDAESGGLFYNVEAETIDQALAEDIALSILDFVAATPVP